jgi:hypothetical protein
VWGTASVDAASLVIAASKPTCNFGARSAGVDVIGEHRITNPTAMDLEVELVSVSCGKCMELSPASVSLSPGSSATFKSVLKPKANQVGTVRSQALLSCRFNSDSQGFFLILELHGEITDEDQNEKI